MIKFKNWRPLVTLISNLQCRAGSKSLIGVGEKLETVNEGNLKICCKERAVV